VVTKEILDGYAARSWRFLVERQQFVMGKREGSYFWNLEGDRRILDCGTGGGVHSLGHRNPEIIQALVGALDHLDSGHWTMATAEHLALHDMLVASAPTPSLNRTVATLGSTETIDLALMFAFRVTGRRKALAYRHGFHGHSGFAALVTGSEPEGMSEHYGLPTDYSEFFGEYGAVESVERYISDECAAVILEPINYETFEPAPADFLPKLAKLCRSRGALLIIDETRTGLSRTGRLYMSSHYQFDPDMVILGKGFGGGVYPVSALLTTQDIFDSCMNQSAWGYQSSLAGSPIAAVVAAKVLEIVQRREIVENIARLESALKTGFRDLCEAYPDVFSGAWVLGGIAGLAFSDKAAATVVKAELFKRNVMCHSASVIEPRCVKFLPCLTSDPAIVGEITQALGGFAVEHRRRKSRVA
jgi:putrescine aminotransferase